MFFLTNFILSLYFVYHKSKTYLYYAPPGVVLEAFVFPYSLYRGLLRDSCSTEVCIIQEFPWVPSHGNPLGMGSML